MAKKNTSSRHKRVQRQRAAADRRSEAVAYEGVPEEIVQFLKDPGSLPHWATFYRAYPTVAKAVEAARQGETVELHCDEHEQLEMRVVMHNGDPVIETVVYVPYGTRDALWSGLLNSDDPDHTLQQAVKAMPALLSDELRADGLEGFADTPPGARLPRFGYRYRTPAAEINTWKEHTEATHVFTPLHEAAAEWSDRRVAAHADAVDILRRHGVPAAACEMCGFAVTNRHPAWPGTWVEFGNAESGPRCSEYDDSALETERELDSLAIGGPHQINEAMLNR
ncbi:hypothetical protein [Streptomyces yangpuensis]|uniref:hypothetical protein n=1 Tax=Streptomyces yangpuensis TaxID=1648182 RepID=UPI0037FC4466